MTQKSDREKGLLLSRRIPIAAGPEELRPGAEGSAVGLHADWTSSRNCAAIATTVPCAR
jgi:hypothetical protein